MSATGVICQDCPYRDVWHPVRTVRDKCKHDLVNDDHTVDYVDPAEVSKVVKMDGEVVKRLDKQAQLVTDGGTDTGATYRCHSVTNDVATLLLCDPVLNRDLAGMEVAR